MVMDWLRWFLGLGDLFTGVFADTWCSAQFAERCRVVPLILEFREQGFAAGPHTKPSS